MKPSPEFPEHHKQSFAPLASPNTEILILGTLPGDKSLELNQYYGHPQNKFWKTIAFISENPIPIAYADKKALLGKLKLGLWDITHTAIRKGSLDSAIQHEQPNNLPGFIEQHRKLKTIGFNGKKAEALYDKYFTRDERIRYITLPSTSPANAGIHITTLCENWKRLFEK